MMLFFSAKQWMQTLKIKFRTSPVRNSITHIFSWYRMLKKRVSLPAFPVQEGKRTGCAADDPYEAAGRTEKNSGGFRSGFQGFKPIRLY